MSAPDPAVIGAYTSGVVSSRTVVRVRFVEPQVEAARAGQEAAPSPFSFEPRIKGRAVWAAPDLLEYRPETGLAAGQDYAATLRLPGIVDFHFRFSAMQQTFNLDIEGLESASATDLAPQILKGTITTSDVAEAAAVEKALSAAQTGTPSAALTIEWEHGPDGLSHPFVVRGIVRQTQSDQVELKWDGRGLDLKKSGSRVVQVPAIEAFKVLEIRAVQSGEDYILVRFSDPLRAAQDLAGLIWSPDVKELHFAIQNNTVRVYATTRFPPEIALNVEQGILNVAGAGLEQGAAARVAFGTIAPALRLSGSGTILPTSQGLVIPVETVNLRGIVVEAMQIYESNVAAVPPGQLPRQPERAQTRRSGGLEESDSDRLVRRPAQLVGAQRPGRLAARRRSPQGTVPPAGELSPRPDRLLLRRALGRRGDDARGDLRWRLGR